MNLCSRRIIGAIGALAMICSWVTATAAETATSRIVSAANTFLSTFDDKQRQSVLFPFDDQKQRANWSNLPVTFVPRASISLKDILNVVVNRVAHHAAWIAAALFLIAVVRGLIPQNSLRFSGIVLREQRNEQQL